jgi:hypothetical protein
MNHKDKKFIVFEVIKNKRPLKDVSTQYGVSPNAIRDFIMRLRWAFYKSPLNTDGWNPVYGGIKYLRDNADLFCTFCERQIADIELKNKLPTHVFSFVITYYSDLYKKYKNRILQEVINRNGLYYDQMIHDIKSGCLLKAQKNFGKKKKEGIYKYFKIKPLEKPINKQRIENCKRYLREHGYKITGVRHE